MTPVFWQKKIEINLKAQFESQNHKYFQNLIALNDSLLYLDY